MNKRKYLTEAEIKKIIYEASKGAKPGEGPLFNLDVLHSWLPRQRNSPLAAIGP